MGETKETSHDPGTVPRVPGAQSGAIHSIEAVPLVLRHDTNLHVRFIGVDSSPYGAESEAIRMEAHRIMNAY